MPHRSEADLAFSALLKKARDEAELSSHQLGEALFLDRRSVDRYLRGDRRPSRELVVRWEELCGLPAGELLDVYERLPQKRLQQDGGRLSDADAPQGVPPAGGIEAAQPQPGLETTRPELSVAKAPRLLRALTGVDEALLSHVPSERARYTRLGGVLLGTGVIAALSMSVALGEVFGHGWLITLPMAAAWGILVMTLNAWLVATLHGTQWRHQRLALLLPGVALAIVFGTVIAEPFVLRVFEAPIERRVLEDRQQQVVAFETLLRECNPESGEDPPAAVSSNGRCSSADIDVEGSPAQVGAADYRESVRKAISKEVAARRSSQAEITVLERLAALHALTQANWYLAASQWLLRLFFITTACLPLLVRLMGGTSSYDRLIDMRLASAERLFREEERTHEEIQTLALMRNREEAQLRLFALAQHQRERVADADDERLGIQPQQDGDAAERGLPEPPHAMGDDDRRPIGGSEPTGRPDASARLTATERAILVAFTRPFVSGQRFASPAPNNKVLEELGQAGLHMDLDTLRGHLRNLYAKFDVEEGLTPAEKRMRLVELVYEHRVIPGWNPLHPDETAPARSSGARADPG